MPLKSVDFDLEVDNQPSQNQPMVGGLKPVNFDLQLEAEEPKESWGDSLVRNVVTGAERLGEGTVGLPGNLVQLSHNLQHLLNKKVVYPLRRAVIPEKVRNLLGFKEQAEPEKTSLPTGQDVRSFVGKALPKDYLESKGTGEEILHNVIESAPLTLLLGGSAPAIQKLGNLAAGQTGMKLAEKAGFGVGGQLLGSLAGNKAFDKLVNYANIGGTAKGLNKLAEDAYTKGYKNADEFGSKIEIKPSNKVVHELGSIRDKFKNAEEVLEKNKSVVKNLDLTLEKLERPVSLKELSKSEQAMNKIYNEVHDKSAKKYISDFKNVITDQLKEAGKQHPEWGDNYFTAKDIYSASKFQPKMLEAFQDHEILRKSLKNPISQLFLLGGTYSYGIPLAGKIIANPLKTAAISGATLAGKKGYDTVKNFYSFMQTPARRKLLQEASEQLFRDNFPALSKTLSKIDNVADKFTKE